MTNNKLPLISPSKLHAGHRKRLLRKYLKYPRSLEPHEFLEILLFNAIPCKNVNGTALLLERYFKNIDNVLNAPPEELMRVPNVGPATARLLRRTGMLREMYEERQTNYRAFTITSENAVEFALENFSGDRQCINFVMLGAGMRVRSVKSIPINEISEINNIDFRTIMQDAFDIGAAYFFVVHNFNNDDELLNYKQNCKCVSDFLNVMFISDVLLWEYLTIQNGVCNRFVP